MGAASDPRIVKYIKAYGTLFVILDGLSKKALQANSVCRCDVDSTPRLFVVFFGLFKLLQVIVWDKAGVERKLSQTSQHTQGTNLHLR